MNLKKYLCTLRQEGSDDQTKIVTISGNGTKSMARAKAYHQWTTGLPFWTFTPKNIRVKEIK